MEKIDYLKVMEAAADNIVREDRHVDGVDVMFVSYLKDLAMLDDNVDDEEFRLIEAVYEDFEDEYNESIKGHSGYFTIEII